MTPLSNFKKSITSRSGEDGIIEEIFNRIGIKNSWCIEFGARDGYASSNTYNLIKNGWKSVQIESNWLEYRKLKKRFKKNLNVICLRKKIEISGENSIDGILAVYLTETYPDLMVIDIDGMDFHVWDSMERFSPRVVMIEYNEKISYDIPWIQSLEGPATGSSLYAIEIFGKYVKGYTLVYAKYGNAIFVRKEDLNFEASDEDIQMYDTPEYTVVHSGKFIQAYDGSIVLFDSPVGTGLQRYFRKKIYVKDKNNINLLK